MSRSLERRARKVALWVLYSVDLTGAPVDEALELCRDSMDDIIKSDPDLWNKVIVSVTGVTNTFSDLNTAIQAVSPRWKLDRMAAIDRTILRIGAWEIMHTGALPLPVINHCVDLGKEYGEKSTSGFVNGLLDEICKTHGIKLK